MVSKFSLNQLYNYIYIHLKFSYKLQETFIKGDLVHRALVNKELIPTSSNIIYYLPCFVFFWCLILVYRPLQLRESHQTLKNLDAPSLARSMAKMTNEYKGNQW